LPPCASSSSSSSTNWAGRCWSPTRPTIPYRPRSVGDDSEEKATRRSDPALQHDAQDGGQAQDRPEEIDSLGSGKLRRIIAYGRKAYDLRELLGRVRDSRHRPKVATEAVARTVFACGLLRLPSFNALEPKLHEAPFQRLISRPDPKATPGSADTLSRTLRRMEVATTRAVSTGIIIKAERNKVFREGAWGAKRYAAIDGWEPVCSDRRHCAHCLVRMVKHKLPSGEVVETEQYYHRYAVAMLIDDRMDLLLDIEPVLTADLRPGPQRGAHDEGELTAAKRLVTRLKKTYGWLDVIVGDALYANQPWLTHLKQLRLGAVVIAKNSSHEPLREASELWRDQPADRVIEDAPSGEHIELWDCRDLETMENYSGKVRVVRAQVLKKGATTSSTWCMLATGAASNLSAHQVLKVGRGRWHIENTGFHQWTTRWQFTHVFTHHPDGILNLFWLFFAAFNLLTLFLYRQLKTYGRDRGKDVTRTISRLVDEMRDDLARLSSSPWDPG
jgi:hypothetical protein